MTSVLNQKMALCFTPFVVIGLLLLGCVSTVKATEPANATQPRMKILDGWRLKNPPLVINREDKLGDFLTIRIQSKPIHPNLPSNSHPVAKLLNQYEAVTVESTSQRVTVDDEIVFEPNLADYFNSDGLKAKTSVGQRFTNAILTVKDYMVSTLLIPLCYLLPGDCKPYYDANQYKMARDKEFEDSQAALRVQFEPSQEFYTAYTSKIRNSNAASPWRQMVYVSERTIDNDSKLVRSYLFDRKEKDNLEGPYNSLPSAVDYSFNNLQAKTISYAPNSYLSLVLRFENPLPSLETVQSLYESKQGFAKQGLAQFETEEKYNITKVSSFADKNKYGMEQVGTYVNFCKLTYAKQFQESTLKCYLMESIKE